MLSRYTMFELLTKSAAKYTNGVAQMYRPDKNSHYAKITFQQFFEKARAIGLGLDAIGLKRGDKVGFIADVGQNWLPVSMGINAIGGVDVPRGTDATQQELLYIFKHADCPIIILDNEKVFNSISGNLADFTNLKTIIFVNAAKPQVPPPRGSPTGPPPRARAPRARTLRRSRRWRAARCASPRPRRRGRPPSPRAPAATTSSRRAGR